MSLQIKGAVSQERPFFYGICSHAQDSRTKMILFSVCSLASLMELPVHSNLESVKPLAQKHFRPFSPLLLWLVKIYQCSPHRHSNPATHNLPFKISIQDHRLISGGVFIRVAEPELEPEEP